MDIRPPDPIYRLAAIVESSSDAIVSKDLTGIITSWNRGAEQLFGYTAAEAIGRSITILIPPDRLAEEDMVLGRVRRGERVELFDTVRCRKDGTTVHVSLTVSPIRDAAGKIVGASKIARDISDRKRIEDELHALSAETREQPHVGRPMPTLDDAPRIDGVTVLAVDDEPDSLDLLRVVLEGAGATVTTARSAREALDTLRAQPRDVIVADVGMPEMDGLQFIRAVRQLEEPVRSTPAAALTAFARSRDRVASLASGFQMHLVEADRSPGAGRRDCDARSTATGRVVAICIPI